jgi:4-hydroxythreonine-4-phosphate dehydrogenase
MSSASAVRAVAAGAPLAVAVGDPAGVGPLVACVAAARCAGGDRIGLFGDADRLRVMLEGVGAPVTVRRMADASDLAGLDDGEVACVHVSSWEEAVVRAHAPSAEGGVHQLRALDAAAAAVQAGHARALVTGPTSKEAIVRAGHAFVGQTEHLARRSGLADDAVTMMFLGPRLRVALVTTHLPVSRVPSAVTPERVARTVRHMVEALLALEPEASRAPRVAVTGLNPHAGEGGILGDEEGRIIAPGMRLAESEIGAWRRAAHLEGPMAAERAFREAAAGGWDGVVTFLHDQATIASKLLDWGEAVNVTWGLPFVRTSVDHGVAYDAAARGDAQPDGMVAAFRMAQRLALMRGRGQP